MTKWFKQEYAKKNAKKNPYYYKDKTLIRTTKLNKLSNERKPAWRWK